MKNKLTLIIFCIFLFQSTLILAQGKNYNWLLGYTTNPSLNKARISFDNNSYSITSELRKIPFSDTQGNISDENGDLLMSSNGYFIANATGDTMQNGAGINPGLFTDDYGSTNGMILPYGNIILPMPSDSTRYVLFHQTGNYNSSTLASSEIFYSTIDMSLDGGLGAVTEKNNIVTTGSFGWGMAACRHGNGRDWWVIALNDSANVANKFLLTPDSTFFVGSQHLQVPGKIGFAGQPSFSPNGSKFAYVSGNGIGGFWTMFIQLFDFDRCAGNFILDTLINYSDVNGNVGFGMSFSPNSKYLYFSTTEHIYKVNTDTSNIGATFQVVAVNDTFLSSPPNIYTNFYLMYLAANGKIYTSSTSSVLHLHEMNYPDSSGLACDMQLHNIYTGHFFIGVPNHPNYYLGHLVGSPCDTLTNINDPPEHDFRFKVFPNPVMDGNIKIMYLLPQNKSGKLEIYDVTGKVVYSQNLPPWSTMQAIALPNLADGIYNVVVKSAVEWESKKIIVFKE